MEEREELVSGAFKLGQATQRGNPDRQIGILEHLTMADLSSTIWKGLETTTKKTCIYSKTQTDRQTCNTDVDDTL